MPHQLLDKIAWNILGPEAAFRLTKLFLTETDPVHGFQEETKLLEELVEIGKVGVIHHLSIGDFKCFGRECCIDRVKQIGARLYEVTKPIDPGFVERQFKGDVLPCPGWAIQELRCLWHGM